MISHLSLLLSRREMHDVSSDQHWSNRCACMEKEIDFVQHAERKDVCCLGGPPHPRRSLHPDIQYKSGRLPLRAI
jgi:hypothetical protein